MKSLRKAGFKASIEGNPKPGIYNPLLAITKPRTNSKSALQKLRKMWGV